MCSSNIWCKCEVRIGLAVANNCCYSASFILKMGLGAKLLELSMEWQAFPTVLGAQ